jgi:hypothetical protein
VAISESKLSNLGGGVSNAEGPLPVSGIDNRVSLPRKPRRPEYTMNATARQVNHFNLSSYEIAGVAAISPLGSLFVGGGVNMLCSAAGLADAAARTTFLLYGWSAVGIGVLMHAIAAAFFIQVYFSAKHRV